MFPGAWQAFSGRGFISKILFSSVDLNRLQAIDDSLSCIVRDMCLFLQVDARAVQYATYQDQVYRHQVVIQRVQALGGVEVRG
jgi:hypothetical protein